MNLQKDWKDGCLSNIMRKMSKNLPPFYASQNSKWVVLDGDVDAIWIESMNTVMDDNKVLTLVSNERIPLTDSMRLLFEIDSLQNATPATVSRAGILYFNDTDIGWQPYVDSWIIKRGGSPARKDLLLALFQKYVPSVLQILRTTALRRIVPTSSFAMVQSLCELLDAVLSDVPEALTESAFVFCAIWAFGGTIVDCEKFSNIWRKSFSNVCFPDRGTVFDYRVDFEDGGLVPWEDSVEKFVSMGSEYSNIVVSTSGTLKQKFFLKSLSSKRYSYPARRSSGHRQDYNCA